MLQNLAIDRRDKAYKRFLGQRLSLPLVLHLLSTPAPKDDTVTSGLRSALIDPRPVTRTKCCTACKYAI